MSVENLRRGLHISVSQVKTFINCPRKYQLAYVLGVEPAFLPIPLVLGSAFHAAAGYLYGLVKATGTVPSLDEVLSIFRDAWENTASGPVPLEKSDEEEDVADPVDKGVAMLTAFHEYVIKSPLPQVVSVEQGFGVQLTDVDTGEVLEEALVGAFDVVVREGERNIIVELKTSAKKWSADQLAYDQQVAAYKLAGEDLGLGLVGLRYVITTKTKKPVVQVEDVQRCAADVEDFQRTALAVLRAVDVKAYWKNKGWACRSCSVRHACDGRP